MTEYLRIEEVADLTGIPISTLRWLRATQRGPACAVISKRLVYKRKSVLDWMESHFEHGDPR